LSVRVQYLTTKSYKYDGSERRDVIAAAAEAPQFKSVAKRRDATEVTIIPCVESKTGRVYSSTFWRSNNAQATSDMMQTQGQLQAESATVTAY